MHQYPIEKYKTTPAVYAWTLIFLHRYARQSRTHQCLWYNCIIVYKNTIVPIDVFRQLFLFCLFRFRLQFSWTNENINNTHTRTEFCVCTKKLLCFFFVVVVVVIFCWICCSSNCVYDLYVLKINDIYFVQYTQTLMLLLFFWYSVAVHSRR